MQTPVYSKAPVDSLAEQLREGHVLGLSPGGVYEAQFGDNNYRLLWKEGLGFARAALQVLLLLLSLILLLLFHPPPPLAHLASPLPSPSSPPPLLTSSPPPLSPPHLLTSLP